MPDNLMEIPDSCEAEAFEKAREICIECGITEAKSIAALLFVRFSKSIPKEKRNFIEFLRLPYSEIHFDCLHDDGREWPEINALVATLFNQPLVPISTPTLRTKRKGKVK